MDKFLGVILTSAGVASGAGAAHYKLAGDSGDGSSIPARFHDYIDDSKIKLGSFKKLVDNEDIIDIWKCTIPTHVIGLVNHHFIVFQTKTAFYSIEKNDEGIMLQRGKTEDKVKDKLCNVPRNKEVKVCKQYSVDKDVYFLVDYILDIEIKIPYDVTMEYNNCQGFGIRIIDVLSKT